MSKITWKGSVLLGPIPPVLVSCGTPEAPNVFTVAWAGIVNTHPPRVSISVRPSRHSYGLIQQSGEFVINLPTTALARAVDWCGVKSGRDVNKFEAMGLTALPASQVGCPLVGESPVNLECKVFQQIPLGTHDLFLADVVAVNVSEELLDTAGKLHLERAGLLAYAHGQYYSLGEEMGTFGWSVRKKQPPARKAPASKKPAFEKTASHKSDRAKRGPAHKKAGQAPRRTKKK
mgnify:FL=1